PGETTLLQTFGTNPQPAAIPEQNFDSRALLISEHEPMARERILSQHRLRQRKEAIEIGAQIHRRGGHEYPCACRPTQHTRSSCSSSEAGTFFARRSNRPLGRLNSATQSMRSRLGESFISANVG